MIWGGTGEQLRQRIRALLRGDLSLVPLSSSLSASFPRILLVTSAFHMHRAQRLFERQGFKVLPFPVDFQARADGTLWRDPTQWLPSARALDDSSRALRELIGRLVYRSW